MAESCDAEQLRKDRDTRPRRRRVLLMKCCDFPKEEGHDCI